MTENIIQIIDSGYEIDMDKMVLNKKYYFTFDDSKYVTWKNNSYELVISEII